MRAVYLENIPDEELIRLDKESAHHLINVVRISVGEDILLLNGQGKRIVAQVETLLKREVILKRMDATEIKEVSRIDVALGMPKKEALELSLKQAQELGIGTIYLVRSQYSQMKALEESRVKSLLVSALEQSNAPFLCRTTQTQWDQIDYTQYEQVVLLDSQNTSSADTIKTGKVLLIVGPEGGFSPEEFSFFNKIPNLVRIKLLTPILRTPTALATGVGVLLVRFE